MMVSSANIAMDMMLLYIFNTSRLKALRRAESVACTGLAEVLARLLFPKLRKRTGRLGGRGALGSARAAILNFFAAAPPAELSPLLQLFLEPLQGAFVPPPGVATAVPELSDSNDRYGLVAAGGPLGGRGWRCGGGDSLCSALCPGCVLLE